MPFGLFSAFLTFVASWWIRKLAVRFRVLDRVGREERKIHTRVTPLLGGVGIGLAILTSILLAQIFHFLPSEGPLAIRLTGFCVAIFILLVGGVLDDAYDLPPWVQFFSPFAASLVVMATGTSILEVSHWRGSGVLHLDAWQWSWSWFGYLLSFTFPADVLTLGWLLGVTYATKAMDGLDSLVTGHTMVGVGLILLLASSPLFFQAPIVVLAWIILGAFGGFLPWNIHPARQFLGEGGSTLAGFSLGFLAIVSGAKVATAFMALGIPLADFAIVVSARLWAGRSPFRGDASHLHFRLLRLGFSQRQVAALYWMLAVVFGLTALGLQTRGKTVLMFGLIFVIAVLSLITATAKQVLSSQFRRSLFITVSVFTALIVMWSVIGLWKDRSRVANTVEVILNDHRLHIEFADTPQERNQGLSDRSSMPSDQGMLFVFPRAERYSFWMPRMHFDLDIIYLQGDRIVDIVRLSAPRDGEEPARHTSIEPADRVLELRAGRAEYYGLKPGVRVPELQIGTASDK